MKEAVVVSLCKNEAEINFQMDIDHHISPTETSQSDYSAYSVGELWWSISI